MYSIYYSSSKKTRKHSTLPMSNTEYLSGSAFHTVITGKVTSLAPGPQGTLQIGVSIIKTYKAGRMIITQLGETMSVKLLSQCRKCPLLRRGMNCDYWHNNSYLNVTLLTDYRSFLSHKGGDFIIMGQVDESGRGTLSPGAFTAPYKAPHHRLLMNIQSQSC